MNAGEHPEDLIDRALAGDLSKVERAGLDDHLGACAACTLHMALGANERAGTASVRDAALNRVAIAGARARLQRPRSRFGWRLSWLPLRLALASVVLVAGLATAAVTLRGSRTGRPAEPAPDVTPKLTAVAQAAPAPRTAAPSDPPAPDETSAPTAEDRPAPREMPTAAALFMRASDLRRQGRVEQAIDTYRLLQQRHPRTREARLSFALGGRLQLERGRPAQALADFDRYLSVGNEITEVAEEALAGRAQALRRLGRRAEEAAAWRALLTRFPGSVYAAQAHARLAQ